MHFRCCSHTNPMEWDNYIDISSSTQWSQQRTAHPTTVAVYTYRRSEKSIYIYSMRMYERMSLIFEVNHISLRGHLEVGDDVVPGRRGSFSCRFH